MPIWFLVWYLFAGLAALTWLTRLIVLGPIMRRRLILGAESYDGPPEHPPRVSVLVAAKDEEDTIERCINTLLEQDYTNLEVIAINDRSTDRTPAILDRLAGRAGDRLKLVNVRRIREGWFGKNNAMREGVDVSTGEWLCFTDADCWQTSSRTLSMAMREAMEHHADFLSITPLIDTPTIWERITQPVCAMVLIFWFFPERVNNPRRKIAYANGAFMLMRRACYEAIGGHEHVRTEVNEDIHMARITKEIGMRLRVVENDDLYRVRMYRTPRDAWRGWSRIFFGCLGTLPRLMVAAAMVLVTTVLPWISLMTAAIGWAAAPAGDAGRWSTAVVVWAIVVLLMQIVMWQVYPVMRIARLWSLTYGLGAVPVVAVMINAMLKVIGMTSTTWRGTVYRKNQLEGETTHRAPRGSVPACADGEPPQRVAPVEAAEEPMTNA